MEMLVQSSDQANMLIFYSLTALSGAILVSAYLMIGYFVVGELLTNSWRLAQHPIRAAKSGHARSVLKPAVLRHALCSRHH